MEFDPTMQALEEDLLRCLHEFFIRETPFGGNRAIQYQSFNHFPPGFP